MSALREVLEGQQSERQMYAALVQAAHVGGWQAFHCHDSRRSPEGFPDWVFLRGGELLVWECKTARGRVSAPQEEWLAAFNAFADAHGLAHWLDARVIRPADMSECLARLASRPGLKAEVA